MRKITAPVSSHANGPIPPLAAAFLTMSDVHKLGEVNNSYSADVQLCLCNGKDYQLLEAYIEAVSKQWKYEDIIKFSFRRHGDNGIIGLECQGLSSVDNRVSIVSELAVRVCEIIHPFSDRFQPTKGTLRFSSPTREEDKCTALEQIINLFTDDQGMPLISFKKQPAPYGEMYDWLADACVAPLFTALAQRESGFVSPFQLKSRTRLIRNPKIMRSILVNCQQENPFVV